MAGSSNYRPGTSVTRNPTGPSGTETVPAQGQNKPLAGGKAGAGKRRGTSRVQAALLSKQPQPPYREIPVLANRPRSKGAPSGV